MTPLDDTCPLCGGPAVNHPDGTVVYVSPSLMGAKDVAEALGVKVPNLKHVKIEPVARISGGAIPVYLRVDVDAEIARREERSREITNRHARERHARKAAAAE